MGCKMKITDYGDYKVVILETSTIDEDLLLSSYSEDNLIYVPLDGYSGDSLSPERFLITKPSSSFNNHMMWEELFGDEEKTLYIEECCKKFYETGKQMIIEDYEFQRDEPFYDYSK
jgi:hypothetical protein